MKTDLKELVEPYEVETEAGASRTCAPDDAARLRSLQGSNYMEAMT